LIVEFERVALRKLFVSPRPIERGVLQLVTQLNARVEFDYSCAPGPRPPHANHRLQGGAQQVVDPAIQPGPAPWWISILRFRLACPRQARAARVGCGSRPING